MAPITLAELNQLDQAAFVSRLGHIFEHSPWVAAGVWSARPFHSVNQLHQAMVAVVEKAPSAQQLALIRAHPDLAGRMAQEGTLTRESTSEQQAAGLDQLNDEQRAHFAHYNAAYWERFGFPFVICARENRKEAILAAFPRRLSHSYEHEIATALAEIAKIAALRLRDVLNEKPEKAL